MSKMTPTKPVPFKTANTGKPKPTYKRIPANSASVNHGKSGKGC